jgi:ATP/maltotriose-dependent transcriptional regulator MalT
VLSDLISAEIAALDDSARTVLAAVAVIGRETSHDLVSDVVELGAGEVEAAVRSAIDAGLLLVDHDAYRFRHPLIGEVVYADLLPPHRQRLHRRIAEVLARQTDVALRRPDRAGELALHLDRSGDIDRAFAALLAAADAAETVAPGAAFGHLARAFELWDSVGESELVADRTARLWQAAELATSTVGNRRAIELARAASALGPPPLGTAWGHERLGRYLWASGQLDESRAEFTRAAELLAEDGPASAAVFAGLGQAELMSGHYTEAERWCLKVFDVVHGDGSAAWGTARRVLGVVRSNQGDPDRAVELCREAVSAAAGAQARAFAEVYLCVALIDAGRYQAAADRALDAVAEGQLTGLHGFDCYFDSLAAEALARLGRWSDAETILARQPVAGTFPAGLLRHARSVAMLAARKGDVERALEHLAAAHAQPVDGWHQTVLDATAADVHLALGDWDRAAEAGERGWASTATTSALWAARFAMFTVAAAVERVLDAQARGEAADVPAMSASCGERIAAARTSVERSPHGPQRDSEAHLTHAAASLSRLQVSDADVWAEAVARWTELGDRWATAGALLREAEAAALSGAADRAASALRLAHTIALELGSAPLLAELEALSRRTRLSFEAPTRVVLDESTVERLGLTTREAEVLALVAAGRTNRQIGEELFVSVKTASVHVSNILRKLGVNSRVDAAAVAQRLGIG